MNTPLSCYYCNRELQGDVHEFAGEVVCGECYAHETEPCDSCERFFSLFELSDSIDGQRMLCPACAENDLVSHELRRVGDAIEGWCKRRGYGVSVRFAETTRSRYLTIGVGYLDVKVRVSDHPCFREVCDFDVEYVIEPGRWCPSDPAIVADFRSRLPGILRRKHAETIQG